MEGNWIPMGLRGSFLFFFIGYFILELWRSNYIESIRILCLYCTTIIFIPWSVLFTWSHLTLLFFFFFLIWKPKQSQIATKDKDGQPSVYLCISSTTLCLSLNMFVVSYISLLITVCWSNNYTYFFHLKLNYLIKQVLIS